MTTQRDKLKGREQVAVPLGLAIGQIPTTNGDMILESVPMPFDGDIKEIHVAVGTIPAATESFTFNSYAVNEGVANFNMFSAAQSFGYSDVPTEFAVFIDSSGVTTSYLTQVTGAGHAPLDALTSDDFFYIISDRPRDADDIDMSGAEVNDVASVLTGEYWNGTAWTDASITDGTDVAGDTLKQDGVISWNANIRRLWVKNTINNVKGFVMRYSVTATLTNPTSIDTVLCRRIANTHYTYTPKYPERVVRTGDRILMTVGTKETTPTAEDFTAVALVEFSNQHPR